MQAILETINPLTYNCYKGLFEIYVIVVGYGVTIMDPKLILYNAIHNFGHIYDDVDSTIRLLMKIDTQDLQWWKRMGFNTGDLIH